MRLCIRADDRGQSWEVVWTSGAEELIVVGGFDSHQAASRFAMEFIVYVMLHGAKKK